MAATPSIRVWKQFDYKGVARLWSNRYHFNGPAPTLQSYFDTLADAIATDEASCFRSGVTITLVELLPAGSDVPTFSKVESVAGTLDTTGMGGDAPGDAAVVVKYSTPARSKKNHPIYLFNYYHGAVQDVTGYPDKVLAAQVTALQEYAQDWIDGFVWGGGIGTIVRAGPNGVTASSHSVLDEISHRDFPR